MNRILMDAQIEGIKAQGNAQLRIIAATSGDKEKKAAAMAKVVIDTQIAIAKVVSDEQSI